MDSILFRNTSICLICALYFIGLHLLLNLNSYIAGAGKCCHPRLLSEGVCTCWLMWFLRSGSCSGQVGRNQLWHSCTNGPFTGQINQAAPGLGHCPESTVWKESHLTPVHWLKGASIITVQHSPCHLLFLFLCLLPLFFLLLSSLPCSPLSYHHGSSFLLLAVSFSSSPPPLVLCYSSHALQLNRLPSGGCDLRRNVISSPAIGSAPPQISCDSFLLHCLPAWRRRPPYFNYIQICSICSDHKSMRSFLKLLGCVVYNVYCYSSEDWSENEDQMETVIIDVEMFMTRNKQGLALEYHKSLPSNSISAWNDILFWVRPEPWTVT